MGLAFNYGMHMNLTSDEMKARAQQLVNKNARKYEISQISSTNGRQTQYPRLYFYIGGGGNEVDELVNWIENGVGPEPNGELPAAYR